MTISDQSDGTDLLLGNVSHATDPIAIVAAWHICMQMYIIVKLVKDDKVL